MYKIPQKAKTNKKIVRSGILKKENILNIRGAILDNNQLKDYLEKIASDHIIQKKSDKNIWIIKFKFKDRN